MQVAVDFVDAAFRATAPIGFYEKVFAFENAPFV